MTKYAATYSFNVRRFIRHEFEAASVEEAERIAKSEAWPKIDQDSAQLVNGDGFGEAAEADAYLMLDALDDGGGIDDELLAETLEEPQAAAA